MKIGQKPKATKIRNMAAISRLESLESLEKSYRRALDNIGEHLRLLMVYPNAGIGLLYELSGRYIGLQFTYENCDAWVHLMNATGNSVGA